MWTMTRYGIFNMVEEEAGSGIIIVKCRVKSHMDNLRTMMPGLGETEFEKYRDYPYRAKVTKEDFAQGMARIAMDVDYPKTKPIVGLLGEKVNLAMLECWSVLTHIETDPNRIMFYYYGDDVVKRPRVRKYR